MSVAGIGSGGSGTAGLERQLRVDQKTLQDDQRSKAAQAVLAIDQARIQADQLAIGAAAATAAARTDPAAAAKTDVNL